MAHSTGLSPHDALCLSYSLLPLPLPCPVPPSISCRPLTPPTQCSKLHSLALPQLSRLSLTHCYYQPLPLPSPVPARHPRLTTDVAQPKCRHWPAPLVYQPPKLPSLWLSIDCLTSDCLSLLALSTPASRLAMDCSERSIINIRGQTIRSAWADAFLVELRGSILAIVELTHSLSMELQWRLTGLENKFALMDKALMEELNIMLTELFSVRDRLS